MTKNALNCHKYKSLLYEKDTFTARGCNGKYVLEDVPKVLCSRCAYKTEHFVINQDSSAFAFLDFCRSLQAEAIGLGSNAGQVGSNVRRRRQTMNLAFKIKTDKHLPRGDWLGGRGRGTCCRKTLYTYTTDNSFDCHSNCSGHRSSYNSSGSNDNMLM